MKKKRWIAACCGFALNNALPVVAVAEVTNGSPAADASQLEEIVITAEKRTSTVQRTPLAITAFTGETLADREVNSIDDIEGTVPNFRMGRQTGGAVISIRGISFSNVLPTNESTASVNINDVYVARLVLQPISFFDVSSLEVLRGPQGTLYGRNATSGALNIHTTLPDNDYSGYARVTLGNYQTTNFEGAIGGPIIDDKLLVRVAGRVGHHSGYANDIATDRRVDDQNSQAGRLTVVATPTKNFTATVFADIDHENDHSNATHFTGSGGLTGLPGASGTPALFLLLGGVDPGLRDVNNGVTPFFKLNTHSLIGTLDWAVTDELTLRSISGYRFMQNEQIVNIDPGTPQNSFYALEDNSKQYSEELQAIYTGKLFNLAVGGIDHHENEIASPSDVTASSFLLGNIVCPVLLGANCPAIPGPVYFNDTLASRGKQYTRSRAVFAQGDLHVTNELTLTAGVRYTDETKRLAQALTPDFSNQNPLTAPYDNLTQYRELPFGPSSSLKFTSTTPKFGIEYQATPHALLYVTYSKGFKSGGFDLQIDESALAHPGYRPEKLTDYEGGIKTKFLDDRASGNFAAFRYKYTDLQVQQNLGGTQLGITNAGKATINGLELETSWLVTDHFRVDLNAAYLDAKYDEYMGVDSDRPGFIFNFAGNRLSNAPKYNGQLAGEYGFPIKSGRLSFRCEIQASSRYYFTPSNSLLESQSAWATGDVFLTYKNERGWSAQLFVRNVTDKIYRESFATPGALLAYPTFGSVSAPRLAGVDLRYEF